MLYLDRAMNPMLWNTCVHAIGLHAAQDYALTVAQDSKRLKTSETSMNRVGGGSSAHKRVVYKSNYLWGCDCFLSIAISSQ